MRLSYQILILSPVGSYIFYKHGNVWSCVWMSGTSFLKVCAKSL